MLQNGPGRRRRRALGAEVLSTMTYSSCQPKTQLEIRLFIKSWDVNPRMPNQDRDAERIVTGSDGSAWFTTDHYRTFHRIR
jgi:hypothetical protein